MIIKLLWTIQEDVRFVAILVVLDPSLTLVFFCSWLGGAQISTNCGRPRRRTTPGANRSGAATPTSPPSTRTSIGRATEVDSTLIFDTDSFLRPLVVVVHGCMSVFMHSGQSCEVVMEITKIECPLYWRVLKVDPRSQNRTSPSPCPTLPLATIPLIGYWLPDCCPSFRVRVRPNRLPRRWLAPFSADGQWAPTEIGAGRAGFLELTIPVSLYLCVMHDCRCYSFVCHRIDARTSINKLGDSR